MVYVNAYVFIEVTADDLFPGNIIPAHQGFQRVQLRSAGGKNHADGVSFSTQLTKNLRDKFRSRLAAKFAFWIYLYIEQINLKPNNVHVMKKRPFLLPDSHTIYR